MKSFQALYFIAVLPDEKIAREVTAFKQYIASHFGASHALKSPPHITLLPPFKWAEAQEATLFEALEQFAEGQPPFLLQLKSFNCFAPRVLFVDVAPNPALHALQQQLEKHLEKTLNLRDDSSHGFNPHMTIAHKDLARAQFQPAWAHFSALPYERECNIEALALVKHNGRVWEAYREFEFLSR
jgi:2'-5' RNA ligase